MIHRVVDKIKTILSDKKVTIFILLLVIISRAIQLTYFYNIVVDASYQLMGTQSLLSGHGVSLPNVVGNNLSEVIYIPLINWPPGYSLIVAPFYYLFNGNYIAAGLTVDICFSIILIFICRSILSLLDIPLYLRNIFTLLTGFFIYYFYFNPCSDSIAITFFLLAIYYTLKLFKNRSSVLRNTILVTLFLLISASIKYLFMPTVFIIPLYIFLKGYSDGNVQFKKAGICSFLFMALLLGLLLVYQKTVGGSATYISATGRGFFPENLLTAYPTFPASFLKPDTAAMLLNSKSAENIIFNIYQVVYIVSLLILIIGGCSFLLKGGFKKSTLVQHFFLISLLVSLSIISLLAGLSLYIEKEAIFSWWLWTYIEEARYHGLPNVLIHLSVFALYQQYLTNRKPIIKYSIYFFIILMIPEMARGILFDINRIKNFNKEVYSWQSENRFQQYADSIIKTVKEKDKDVKIVVTGTSYNMNHRVVLNSHVPPLTDVSKINSISTLNTTSPVLLLVMLQKDSLSAYQPYLLQENKKEAGTFMGFQFYTTYVQPH